MENRKEQSSNQNNLSIVKKLTALFMDYKLYTVDELVELTGSNINTVRASVSKLKNDSYSPKEIGRLDLVQDTGFLDRKRRWGLRGAKEYYS